MDLWAIVQKRLFNIPSLNYQLVGRWLGHTCRAANLFTIPLFKQPQLEVKKSLAGQRTILLAYFSPCYLLS
ncbi:DUF2938 family protein [Photorhabdus asymbiotica]